MTFKQSHKWFCINISLDPIMYYSFMSAICNKGITSMEVKSASTDSMFCKVVTFSRLSFRKINMTTAKSGIISSESYARIRSQSVNNCSAGKCPLKARIIHLMTTRNLKKLITIT